MNQGLTYCPVCEKSFQLENPAFCSHCGWEFKVFLTELTGEERRLYNQQLEIAQKNWHELTAAASREEEYKKNIEEASRRIRELERDCHEVTRINRDNETENEKLKEELEEQRQKFESLQQELEKSTDENNERHKKRIEEASKRIYNLECDINWEKQGSQINKAENERLKKDLEEQKKKSIFLQQQLNQRAEEKSTHVHNLTNSLQKENERLSYENKQLQKTIKNLNEKESVLEKNLNKAKRQYDSLSKRGKNEKSLQKQRFFLKIFHFGPFLLFASTLSLIYLYKSDFVVYFLSYHWNVIFLMESVFEPFIDPALNFLKEFHWATYVFYILGSFLFVILYFFSLFLIPFILFLVINAIAVVPLIFARLFLFKFKGRYFKILYKIDNDIIFSVLVFLFLAIIFTLVVGIKSGEDSSIAGPITLLILMLFVLFLMQDINTNRTQYKPESWFDNISFFRFQHKLNFIATDQAEEEAIQNRSDIRFNFIRKWLEK